MKKTYILTFFFLVCVKYSRNTFKFRHEKIMTIIINMAALIKNVFAQKHPNYIKPLWQMPYKLIALKSIFLLLLAFTIDVAMAQKNSSSNNLTRDSNIQEFLKNKEKSPVEFINYTNRFNPALSTNDPNVWFFIHNDSNNIWQIGKPNKPPLDTTFYQPNALLTDTIYPYPINNHSIFELHARKPLCCPDLCWSRMLLDIAYIADVDSAKDGFFIEVTYNDSGIWTNIFNDDFADEKQCYQFSTLPDDTLFNGEWGISHIYQNIPSWFSYFNIEWQWLEQNGTQFLVDSLAFRFHFVSDSVNTNKQGIEIMYIHFDVNHMCGVTVEECESDVISLFPNPINSLSVMKLNRIDNYELEIFDITGRIILSKKFSGVEFNIGQYIFFPGYFYYTLTSSKPSIIQGSFIVNEKI